MKHKEPKEHKTRTQSNDKTIISIIIGAALIIISTLIYKFEIAGKIFYLRYIVTFIAAAILFDALSLKYNHKLFRILKFITVIIVLFIIFVLIYFIMTIPKP